MSVTQVLLIFPKKINHDFYTTYKEEGLLLLLKKNFNFTYHFYNDEGVYVQTN